MAQMLELLDLDALSSSNACADLLLLAVPARARVADACFCVLAFGERAGSNLRASLDLGGLASSRAGSAGWCVQGAGCEVKAG